MVETDGYICFRSISGYKRISIKVTMVTKILHPLSRLSFRIFPARVSSSDNLRVFSIEGAEKQSCGQSMWGLQVYFDIAG